VTVEKKFIAVLMSDPKMLLDDQEYYGPMLRALSETLLARGLIMRPVQCLHEHQKQHFLLGPDGVYSGVVALGSMFKHKEFVSAVVEKMTGPKVMLDHHFPDIPMHSVREDALAGMRMLTEHMLSLGHRHIAYLDMDRPDGNPWKREGINLALRQAGHSELPPGWVAGCRWNFSDAAAALEWFMDLSPRPTGIICSDDNRALFLLQAAAELGMRIPDDLSIAGYGDTAVSTGRSNILTSVAFEGEELGRKAAELVSGPDDAKPVSVLVTPRLAPRNSTAAPKS
jgi:DNA-binding LacI/PurR family transcriptional regulator